MALILRKAIESDLEWMREQRNRPEIYKYFRQDRPITKEAQVQWWRSIGSNWNLCRRFIVLDGDKKVGVAGFDPYCSFVGNAEFTIFILPEYQKHGYGKETIELLLTLGFDKYKLSCIYSDVLLYPKEWRRWMFYRRLGFKARPYSDQGTTYKKQGKTVKSLRFFMTKDMWESRRDKKHAQVH